MASLTQPLGAGAYNSRVTLQAEVIVYVKGVPTKTITDYAAGVPANVVPVSGREFFEAQRVNSQVNWKVTIRYRTDVKPAHRVLFGTRVFEVVSVMPDVQRYMEVLMMCREVNQ